MITVTPAARTALLGQVAVGASGASAGAFRAVRITVDEDAPPPGFGLALVSGDDQPGDRAFEAAGLQVRVSARAAERFEAAVLDYEDDRDGGGFRVVPTAAARADRSLSTDRCGPTGTDSAADRALGHRVRAVLEEHVNPTVAAHGGAIRLERVVDGVARVVMSGGCQGCSAARLTLKGIVERMLCARVPGLRAVEDVTDHAAGAAPFLPATA